MRAVVNLIALVWFACSSGAATTGRATTPSPSRTQLLRVFARQQMLTIQMTPDDQVLDGAGVTLGNFDEKSRAVMISGMTIALDDVVRLQADRRVQLELPIGTWLIDVAANGDIRVNGERWGRVDGFDATPQAWQRLEALFAALPVMPTPAPRRGQSP